MIAVLLATLLLPFALDLLPRKNFFDAQLGYSPRQLRLMEGARRELMSPEPLDFLFIGTSVFAGTLDLGMIEHHLQGLGTGKPRILLLRFWAADMFGPLAALQELPPGLRVRHVFLEVSALLSYRRPYSSYALRTQDAWPYLRHATIGDQLSFLLYKIFFGPVKLKELLLPTRWRPNGPEPLDPWITGGEGGGARQALDNSRGARRPRAFSWRPGQPISPLMTLIEPREFQVYLLGEIAKLCRERGIALHLINSPMFLGGKITTPFPRLPRGLEIDELGSDIFSAPGEFGKYRGYFSDDRHIHSRGKREFTWAMLPIFGRIYGENP